jgi:hypothetical protein
MIDINLCYILSLLQDQGDFSCARSKRCQRTVCQSASCRASAAYISRRSATMKRSVCCQPRRAPKAGVGPKETRILVFIRRGRELGFTLHQIRTLLTLGGPGKASCAEVREIAEHHIEDISAKIDDLTRLNRLLRKTVAQCSGGKAPDCPVLDILDVQGLMTPRT